MIPPGDSSVSESAASALAVVVSTASSVDVTKLTTKGRRLAKQ